MSLIEGLIKIQSTRKHLREFGLVVGGVLGVLGVFCWWRGRDVWMYPALAGVFLIGFGLLYPPFLKPFQKVWMALGLILGAVVSRVILAVLFYLVLTPIGLILRLKGQDLLELRMCASGDSYWKPKQNKRSSMEEYERQF